VTQRWLEQVEALAREALPAAVFRYVAEGAREEISLREATPAWDAIRLAPRVLRDVRAVHTNTTLLDTDFAAPLGIAPMTLQRAADPEGEVTMAAAAERAGLPMVLSSNAGSTFADVAATGAQWWLQVYVAADRRDSVPMLEAAAAAGAEAVVLTADTPVLGTRYPLPTGPGVWEVAEPGWIGANAGPPPGPDPEARPKAMDLGPADIEWLAETTGLPVVVKGVLRPDDARRCLAAGARGVWISNHGGRQLDQAVATARCVEAVRAAVGDAGEVYVDGGIRNGVHALAALALGADAVFVGRPLFHALAAGGGEGVDRALEELTSELVEAMRLSGCARLQDALGLVAPGPAGVCDRV
jgi:4-hydroxymandelate oxidase